MDSDTLAVIEQEEIRQQIDESRAALVDKLNTLEEKVVETVQNASSTVAEATATVLETVNNATSSVSETVESVNAAVQGTVNDMRMTVSDTVETVRDTFDLSAQVNRHPWAMFAGAIATGYLGGYLLQDRSVPKPYSNGSNGHSVNDLGRMNDFNSPTNSSPRASGFVDRSLTDGPSVTSSVAASSAPVAKNYFGDLFSKELTKLQGLAIGVSMGLVRDVIAESTPPSFRSQVKEVFDEMTEKLGGDRITGPVLPTSDSAHNAS